MMASVKLDRVRKVYDNGQVAVRGASFEIADGELMVLVGPSGCGKSTLLRMIAGLEEISDGNLLIGERRVNDVAPKDRDIAMVFQSYALYPHMTVAENLAFGLKLRGVARAEIDRRVDAAAETLGMTHMLGKLPREMSGGQRQRVALGRALVREPSVFLLDEPLSNLDAKLRDSVRTEIGRVLKDGEIQQIDTPMALYEKPANLFVAGFLGSPAMNVLYGTLRRDEGLHLVLDGGGQIPLGNAAVADALVGRRIALGIRPEHLQPAGIGKPAFEAHVDLIEPVGNEVFVNLRFIGQPLVARMPPQVLPEPGQGLRVTVENAVLHCFDPDSGLRLG
jgi:multiple sugar transport system ATP-binding protein